MTWLYIFLGLLGVVITFGVLPFINFYVLPFKKHELSKNEAGEYELSDVNKVGIASVTDHEDHFVVKRADGVQKVDIYFIYKVKFFTIKKHYYIEFGGEEAIIKKPEKGVLIGIYLTSFNGNKVNKKKSLGINIPFLVVTTLAQVGVLLAFSIFVAIDADYSLPLLDERINFYVAPIILSVVIPAIFLSAQLFVLSSKKMKKEVK